MSTDPATTFRQYHQPGMVPAFIARRGVATFHVAEDDHRTPCGIELAMLKAAGWARQLQRRGLTTDAKCQALLDGLTDELATERTTIEALATDLPEQGPAPDLPEQGAEAAAPADEAAAETPTRQGGRRR